jgi:hypothetical protein
VMHGFRSTKMRSGSQRFEQLDEDSRIETTRHAFREGKTMVERWSRLTRRQSRSWEHRAEKSARLLRGCDSVVDIGCGRMLLEKHLEPPTRYVPVDVVRRDQRTIVVDLNDPSEWPEAVSGDAAAVLGVVEYIHDLERFIGRLSSRFDRAVVSYSVSDLSGLPRVRLANGWTNSFSRAELEKTFSVHGWSVIDAFRIDSVQWLWHLVNSSRPSGSDRLPSNQASRGKGQMP